MPLCESYTLCGKNIVALGNLKEAEAEALLIQQMEKNDKWRIESMILTLNISPVKNHKYFYDIKH